MNTEKLLEQFSTHLKNAIARALALSSTLEHAGATPLHLLYSLSEEKGSVAEELINRAGLKSASIYETLQKEPKTLTPSETGTPRIPILTLESKSALERAMICAFEHEHTYVGTEHLLQGLIGTEPNSLRAYLTNHGVSPEQLEHDLQNVFHGVSRFPDMNELMQDAPEEALLTDMEDLFDEQKSAAPDAPKKLLKKKKSSSPLESFATELTAKDVQEKIDPVIGREQEIERVIHILCRRNKNNPILVGEPGVGKTAIVEGLAKRIAEGNVPYVLKHKKIYALDLTLLVAGTMYRGEFEGRLKQLIDEVSKRIDCLLFIDELHNIIGAGSNQGTMDAANILKPALARGLLHCIGATTADEYEKFIASDAALERRFQMVLVQEPTPELTIRILDGVVPYYERFHEVTITKDAITKAVELAASYMHDAHFPDKAIDLLDEACARKRTKTPPTKERKKHDDLVERIKAAEHEKSVAISEERLKDAIKAKERLIKLKKILAREEKKGDKETAPRPIIDADDIARATSERLLIPLERLVTSDWETLKHLAPLLDTKIIGQKEVTKHIAHTLRRSHIRPRSDKRPRASFLFTGPSGVGKTALAKELAKTLFHDEKALITFSMNEFAEAHSVSKLLGSPAGYIGHKERNRFTDLVKKRPQAVILFDEIDKAHPDVQKLLFQILDEGQLTDAGGKTIRFTHAIIILTTNVGAEVLMNREFGFGHGDAATERKAEETRVIDRLKEVFGAPLIGRLSGVCVFRPLTKADVAEIISLHLDALRQTLRERSRMFVTKPDVPAFIAESAWSKDTGARYVDSVIETLVHDLLIASFDTQTQKKTLTLAIKKETLVNL